MAGLERDRELRTPSVQAFASELRGSLQAGTQIMGGVVTSKLAEPGAGRVTREWTGHETGADGGPAFTGQVQSLPSSPEMRGDGGAWAATEISFPPSQPQSREQTPPQMSEQRAATAARQSTSSDQPSSSPSSGVVSKPQRRTNRLVWALGALVIAAIAAILYLTVPSSSSSGFALVVKGAPPGSQVFINETRQEASAVDGGLRVSGLGPGQLNLRVSHEGFADFITTIAGAKGEVQTCEAQLLPEIDYNGLMVPIPAGEFEMGSDNFEADERPAHKVTLPAYYIDKYEVTNAQYKKFCDETGKPYPPNPPFDPAYFTDKPDYPVLGVTFEDALAYASWAGKRLPTEEEWEKAASWDPVAHRKRLYPWGDESPVDRANIATGKPIPVTQANGDRSSYGVLNMSGNALEWADTAYKAYEGNEKPDPDYHRDERVVRGATFLQVIGFNEARTSYRNHLPRVFPKGKSTPVGIRCAASANDPRIQRLLGARIK
jgi:iron(II)-dependent oxidoreductase